ncbi:MAG: hypothetical protein TREMPRED_002079 [Tremellales sp. Tagirdzhanova-0007]|nr:MAG: hypothetical protein TREMPRED_002079 [Tremellales sp. Tagirdzhanova-0007]
MGTRFRSKVKAFMPEAEDDPTGSRHMPQRTPSEGQIWGRVLIAGGTNWATNGRKDRAPATTSDLHTPHILRSLCNVKITKIITGPAANFAVVIDTYGLARMFGKMPSESLSNSSTGVISEYDPYKFFHPNNAHRWVDGAAGRTHVLLVDDQGEAWGCGNNAVGQLGLFSFATPSSPCQEVGIFTKIPGPWSKEPERRIVQVTAGHTFSLFLTDSGQVYAAGSSEYGQLGNGKTGERIVTAGKVGFDVEVPARLVLGLTGKNIIQIASGHQHSLAMDAEGYVYAWGNAGYARLGLQDQKNRLVPTIIPSFAGNSVLTRASSILCGPTNSVVIDRQKIYHMAGKWKLSGDGSTGQPYTYFKSIQDIINCQVLQASCGGCTHFITTPDSDGKVMTIGFGQGVLYGELGLGNDADKSAAKPQQIMPLADIDVIDVSAGAFFTLFLARPNDSLSNIPRHPVHVASASLCLICNMDNGVAPLECEKCDEPYHTGCLDPPLEGIPDGEWFCPKCEKESEATPDENSRNNGPERGQNTSLKSGKRKSSGVGGTKAVTKKRR